MNLLAPLSDKQEVNDLVRAGADEFYCGYIPSEWQEKYSLFAFLNMRSGKHANFTEESDIKEAIRLVHSNKKKIFLTLNSSYTKKEIGLVNNLLSDSTLDFDGYVVSDLGLIQDLKDIKKEIILGTGGACFNSHTVDFYKKYNISRIVLPHHLEWSEIIAMLRSNPQMQFELFILNSLCPNINAFCHFHHEFGDSLIRPKCLCKRGFDFIGEGSLDLRDISKRLSGMACGACRIYDLKDFQNVNLKIVERNLKKEDKLSSIKFIKESTLISKQAKSREEHTDKVKELYGQIFADGCKENCYYP